MAKVMLRQNQEGKIFFYVAKKDMEEVISSVEFDTPEAWGGKLLLTNGETWEIPVAPKKLPCEVVAKRVEG